MVIPTPGGGYAGCGAGDDLDLHMSPSKLNLPIYCNLSDIGSVSGGRAAPRGTISKAVVGTEGMDWEGVR